MMMTLLHLVGFLCEIYYDAQIHAHQVYKECELIFSTNFVPEISHSKKN
jgi:hypothetical protein